MTANDEIVTAHDDFPEQRAPGFRGRCLALAWMAGFTLLTSCLAVPVPQRLSGGSGGSLGWKVIVEKREPNLLLAADVSVCEVPPNRFASLRRGDRAFCHWRPTAHSTRTGIPWE
jgi:hypothetical protein